MPDSTINRRDTLKFLGASVGMSLLPETILAKKTPAQPFIYSLNMSTIRGHQLGMVKELETASKAGFRSVEIWMDSFNTYMEKGGTIADLNKRIKDLDLKVENCIGFAQWIVDDEATRQKGVEQLKKEMDMLASIGCFRTAAPPMGATKDPGLNLQRAAERYNTILELSKQTGVVPQLELWGFSQNLNHLSDVLYVAAESGHPSARLLLDVYHIYKGGSSVDSLHLVGKAGLEVFHINDYPANIAPENITDPDRIYPGDGVAPIRRILEQIRKADKPLVLSFEVFNKTYYSQDPLLVCKTALSKMKAITQGV
jgi:sugar phosphate isomerase/epimerase